MATLSIKDQIVQEVDALASQQQEQLLQYAKRLNKTVLGTPGEVLLTHIDIFQFEPSAVDEMMKAIDEECEKIDWEGWQ